MRQASESFPLPCAVDIFWGIFSDPAYTRALYLDCLGFKGYEVLGGGLTTTRKLRIVPKLSLPEPLARIVGEAFAYEEHGTLDRAKGEWSWRMVQPASAKLPELISTRGTMRIREVTADECLRIDDIQFEGKLFGLGRLIESTAEREARSAWALEQPFFLRWLNERVRA